MTDRVYPHQSPPAGEQAAKQVLPLSSKPFTEPGTYVIRVPKDQIHRYPPPENAKRVESYSRRKNRSNRCCRCLCCVICVLLTLLVLLSAAVGILYLIFRPKLPRYSVEKVSITGFNLSSSAGALAATSPEFDVTVRGDNPNSKIGIMYLDGSRVDVFYGGVGLCDGKWPSFYQPSKNITVFQSHLRGSGVAFSSELSSSLMADQSRKSIPLGMKLEAPIKIKFGSVKTWKITVKVWCDFTVDNLTAAAKIISMDCDVTVKLVK